MGSCLSFDERQSTPRPHSGEAKNEKRLKKKQGSRCSSSLRRDEQLQKIPGRLFLNGSSNLASLFSQQGRKGINQDAMIVWENFGSREDTVFCGVFDGHGPYGHLVARSVRDSLPLKLNANFGANLDDLRQNSMNAAGSMISEETASMCCDKEHLDSLDSKERERLPEIFVALKKSFLNAFKCMDKELYLHPKIDSFCSGTTAVTLIKQGSDLIIGNIGDSRAVLGARDVDDSLIAIQLTVDLKPNLPKEKERIKRCKGRVFALRDEPDVARVWLPNYNSPGLAMARAFGDFCLKNFGLISVPEISYRCLTEKDEFIVLATDGVWDVLSNTEVVELVASAPSRSSAARFLVQSAVQAWRCMYPTSKVDDCAVVCLFLNADPCDSMTSFSDARVSESSETLENGNKKEKISIPMSLDRSATVRSTCDQVLLKGRGLLDHVTNSKPHYGEKPLDYSTNLEGVSRANTVLTVPGFVETGEKQLADSNINKL